MSSFLYRVGRFSARHRWAVLIVWILLAVGGGSAAGALGNNLQSSFDIPGTQAQTALDALEQRFPQLSGASGRVVVAAPDGESIADHSDAISTACEALATAPDVSAVTCPYPMSASGSTPAGTGTPAQVSDDGRMVFISAQLTVAADAVPASLVHAVDEATAPLTDAGLQVAVSGIASAASGGVDWTEAVGMLVAFIVLAVTFGSLLAAGMPLVTAAIGVGVATSSITIVAAFAPVQATAPVLATMLGLAVGIDYALLITSRHRDNLRQGMPPAESVAVAIATAGTAVVFAGMTVMIALLGLAVAGIPFLTVMGLGAAAAVLAALAVAVTLLPAILALFGHRLAPREHRPREHRPRERRERERRAGPRRAAPAASDPAGRGPAWVRLATRVPLATVGVIVVALLALAAPAAGMRLTLPDAGYDPAGSPQRVAYDLLDEGFGPGFNGPLLVTADISRTLDIETALDALDDAFTDVSGVASVSQAFPNEALDLAVLTITPTSAPASAETGDLVQRLRGMASGFDADNGFTFQVTGQTALAIDISARLAAALVPFALVVVGLCVLLLTVMFRSIAVPLTATFGYLLTVGAALGVATAIFEWGWAAGLLGVGKVGPVISFMPILVMAVLFGLAMDYHVFLVSRMRERYAASGDAAASVRTGFAASARVVTAAALIMFSVFFSFVPGGSAIIQPIALALAVGVLIDAFVVRMTLVPALMALLGDRAWWLPGWLARVLPDADIEGEAVQRMLGQRTWLAGDGDRSTGIHTRDARIGGSAPLTLALPPRGLLLVRGAAAGEVCAGLAGRTGAVEGDVAVDGRLLPFERATLAARTAHVAATAPPPDAETVLDALRSLLRLAGVSRRERAARTRVAAEVFDRLTGILAEAAPDGPAALIGPRTPTARLADAPRWLLSVAAASASGLPIIVLDLRGRPASLCAGVLAQLDDGATVVLAADESFAPVTDRDVVVVQAPLRAVAQGDAPTASTPEDDPVPHAPEGSRT
ncbi:MMPL family transporter [Microbacterium sp. LRZ72]|uniref:MMPL family transporter n=1 Tax=Microbacterium sp. LRZ72 TaxID=2942481 RepID=UPI0029B0D662|nr:MMPL family transporter [Microbacterium sp. LRZ72]MDX2375702.1 MMPL family transporter [Microbacterium sp. LRZ72]